MKLSGYNIMVKYSYSPIHILYVSKVVSLEVSEDSLSILYAGHSLEIERLAD